MSIAGNLLTVYCLGACLFFTTHDDVSCPRYILDNESSTIESAMVLGTLKDSCNGLLLVTNDQTSKLFKVYEGEN